MTAPRPLSYWVRTLETLLQDERARAAERAGLDRGQWQVLSRLRLGAVAEDAIRESLAPFLLEGDSVDDVLDRVVGDGLVEHRANEYRLTDRGSQRIADLEDETDGDVEERALASVPPAERDALLATLERVATNLGWQPA